MGWVMTGARTRWVVGLLLLPSMRPADAQGQQDEISALTLEEAIELALARSPAMVAADAGVTDADAARLVARGSWLPTLSLNGVYANSSNERFDQTSGRLVSQSYSATTTAGVELFDAGRRIAENRAASAGSESARADRRAQRFETILATTEAFYGTAAAEGLLVAAQQRLERAERQFAFARTRLELGTATTSDALRAELEVGNAELAVLDGEANLRRGSLELGRHVGVTGGITPASSSLPASAPELPPLDELLQWAREGAPSVLAAEATLKSSRAEKFASYTPYLPTARVTGGYDWFAFDFPPQERSWNVRFLVSLPLLNGFQREASLQRASAAERVAEARSRDVDIAIRVRVEDAVQQIQSAEQRVRIADRSVELAREDLRVQEERYQIGVATILELQASQVTLAEVEVQAVTERQILGTAVAQLEAILGRRLDSNGTDS